jgi:hypothetical protein
MAVVQPPGAHDSEGPKLVQHEPLLALDTLLQRCPTVASTAGASTSELIRCELPVRVGCVFRM